MEFIKGTALAGASRFCFGCEQLGGTDWGDVDVDEIRLAINLAISRGVNFFDTAAIYGLGLSEERLTESLGENRSGVVIATKGGLSFEHPIEKERVAVLRDSSPKALRAGASASLTRLRINSLPVFFVHWPDSKTPIKSIMSTLMSLKRDGKIERIGLSNFSAEQIVAAQQYGDVDAVQVEFSLVAQEARDVIKLCAGRDISVCAYGILAQGLLTGKYTSASEFGSGDRRHRLPQFSPENIEENLRKVSRVLELAASLKRPPVQVAIRYVLQYPGISSVIIGIKSRKQVSECTDVFDWELSAQEIAFLENRT